MDPLPAEGDDALDSIRISDRIAGFAFHRQARAGAEESITGPQ